MFIHVGPYCLTPPFVVVLFICFTHNSCPYALSQFQLASLKGRGYYDITVLHCVIRIRGSPLRTTICSQRFHVSDPSRILKLLFRYRAGIQNVKRIESQNLHSFFWFLKVPQCFGRKLRFPTSHWSLTTDTN